MTLLRALDVSGIFHPVWRVKEAKGEPIGSATAETIRILRERAEARGADYVVACCDTGRSFRHAIGLEWAATHPEFKGYKGHRPEKDPAMMAALDRVIDELEADGVPVLRAAGFEADDVIATVTAWAVSQGYEVEIATEDKDLMQLVRDTPRVTVVRRGGEVFGPAEVAAKFGVPPDKLGEYLAIVGDASDHVPGVKGLGDKAAQGLIARHGGYAAATKAAREEAALVARGAIGDNYEPRFTPAQRARLIDGEAAFLLSLRLTTLRADAPVDLAVVTAPRKPKPKQDPEFIDPLVAAIFSNDEEGTPNMTIPEAEFSEPSNPTPAAAAPPVNDAPPSQVAAAPAAPIEITAKPQKPDTSLAVVNAQALAAPNGAREFERQLEPGNFAQALKLADAIARSRRLKDIEDANQVLLQMALGRSIGLNLFQSLCQFYIVEGKGTMAAQLVVARIRQHAQCEYFRKREGNNTSATWESKRKGEARVMVWTFTLDDAKRARLGGYGKNNSTAFDAQSNWAKYPAQMLSWRAALFLAREEWTEITAGIYDPDEIREQREAPSMEDAA